MPVFLTQQELFDGIQLKGRPLGNYFHEERIRLSDFSGLPQTVNISCKLINEMLVFLWL